MTWMSSGMIGSADNHFFPEIKGKFPSKALGQEISDFRLEYGRGAAVIFDEGTLYSRRDSGSYDYFFVGRGRIELTDSSDIQNSWWSRLDGHTQTIFTTAYMCGADIPGIFGLGATEWREEKIPPREHRDLRFILKAPDKHFGISLSGELGIWSDRDSTPLPIWLDLGLENNNQMVFLLSPTNDEQLHIFLYDKKFNAPYFLANYRLNENMATQPFDLDSMHIAINLENSGHFTALCDMTIAPGNTRRGIDLFLPYLFTVDSVVAEDGARLEYIKKKYRYEFYISRMGAGGGLVDHLKIYYRGKFLQADYFGTDYPVNMTAWFPQLPRRNLCTFTIDYTIDKDVALLSVGDLISETIEGDCKTVRYRTRADISYISFASGIYDTLVSESHGIPLRLFVRRENTQGLFNRNIPGDVLDNLTDAFGCFYEWFGPPITEAIDIVDQPLEIGQSSPGLIHLSQISFNTSRDQSRFRAHEMAHQWWGHTVVPKSTHDAWLSEGLAEYSAAMFLLYHEHDTTDYRNLTDNWRRHILEEGKLNDQYSLGYKAGPISTGTRFLQSYSPGDYVALVYYKAAYMLQMLHYELDGPAYATDNFISLLADYRRTYDGQQVSSADFMRIAQKYLGPGRTAAFFRQWFYDWRVPAFEVHYESDATDAGTLLTGHFDVEGVGPDFSTPLPIEVEFVDNSRRMIRLESAGPGQSFTLGPFSQPVKKIRLDPDHIILAREMKVTAR